ncbi:NADP-dependent oxidoreductase [Pokkaliibacter sp. MBI-7]|uniref:NADP-dependent oxidoreductase n=1 Tax=Pokkaliibacter sp. MBI-7 TaxID=3040600 RepID=UPI00244AF339|nr:NADP-dependent oxidoreductase [Pokkaliibacter sp. MBI-7]MDH2431390.1 NADP-dependent oxidoreductase [Pokkaliibacter sp. MBI-7]
MRVIGLNQYGGPDVLEAFELPTPHATAGQVRVKVHAAGINPVDEMLRSGDLASWYAGAPYPYIPGMDIAGTLDEISADVDPALGLRVGQRVTGIVDNFGNYGGYSEYVCLPARSVTAAPPQASFAEAASFLMNALTARNALDNLTLAAGARILVTGAAGAVGAYTVALAKAAGFEPVAIATAADEPLLHKLGAAMVIARGDHLAQRVREHFPQGVDAVVDAACIQPQILAAVCDQGQIIVLRPASNETLERGITTRFVNVRERATDQPAIRQLADQVSAGLLPMRVEAVFPASEAAAAHRRLDQGRLRGRLILDFEHSGL